jgi:hypothetical protein
VKDLSETRFGRLVAKRFLYLNNRRKAVWLCKCDCGNEKPVVSGSLVSGRISSCGCRRAETARAQAEVMRSLPWAGYKTHGKSGTPEHKIWCQMKQRCLNHNDQKYADYGGRGITVCDRWVSSFENFISDMGQRPSMFHSIERERNDDGYGPDNCKWALPEEQGRNKRNNRMYFVDGEAKCITDCASLAGIRYSSLWRMAKKENFNMQKYIDEKRQQQRRLA